MKKLFISVCLISLLSVVLFSPSCKEEKPDDPFTDEARQQYEAAISLQEQSIGTLADFESTMDSADAVMALAQWFRDNELVESAVVSTQGISVEYKSSILGGVFLDGNRYDEEPHLLTTAPAAFPDQPVENLNNTPTNKSGYFMAASYDEFTKANQYQNTKWTQSFNSLAYAYTSNTNITLDILADVRERGSVLCFDSHGYAWPEDQNISEVYFLTSQQVSNAMTQKYYKDVVDQDIIALTSGNPTKTKYGVSPAFIKKYNTFKNDTVLFYGGFCYSFLGSWPSLTEVCASGTYFGFDWVVGSGKCALWAEDLINKMADKTAPEPWTVEDWMSKSTIEKQYFDEAENKTVHILYEGNGALTLWEPAYSGDGAIVAVAPDGAPIAKPGFVCQEYTLRCNVTGQLPPQVEYFWDLSDGNGGIYALNGNEMNCLYIVPGSYTIRVEVRNDANDEVIKEFTTQVQFEDPSFVPFLNALKILESGFDPGAITLTDGNPCPIGYFSFNSSDAFTTPLTWSDTTFFAQLEYTSGSSFVSETATGEVSADGKTLKRLTWTIVEKYEEFTNFEVTYEIVNIPILIRDEWNCFYGFAWDIQGAEVQNHVATIQYRDYNYDTQDWITIQSVNWGSSYMYGRFFNENQTEKR